VTPAGRVGEYEGLRSTVIPAHLQAGYAVCRYDACTGEKGWTPGVARQDCIEIQLQAAAHGGKYKGYTPGRHIMYRIIALISFVVVSAAAVPAADYQRIRISDDIEIIKLSEHSYVHVSWATLPKFGRFGSNGYIYVNGGEAMLFDTPVDDELTEQLAEWITTSLKARIVGFVPNHWHDDCMGGLKYILSKGIPTYAHEKTIAIAKARGLPVPRNGFRDTLTLKAGGETVICRYFGPAHSIDNITVWVPSERVLFAGCMVKDLGSKALGNLSDADLSRWPGTIGRVMGEYPGARIVIPGHGDFGGIDLLLHTRRLLEKGT
jgi:metallo-beta-lactamase class B